nr:hypothetical protein [Parafrankia elaeagni]
MVERKKILLRLDPAVHDALARWASDELRSTNAQIEHLLRAALAARGRLPRDVGAIPRRGRPRHETETKPVPQTETEPEAKPETETETETAAETETEPAAGSPEEGNPGPARRGRPEQ